MKLGHRVGTGRQVVRAPENSDRNRPATPPGSAPSEHDGSLLARNATEELLDRLARDSSAARSVFAELKPTEIGVGSDLGNFSLLRQIGQGGSGRVYLALQRNPHRPVAVKLIPPGWADPDSLERLRFEAEIIARLDHPCIARVLASGEATDSFGDRAGYIAMELVEDAMPITAFANTSGLSMDGRMHLFREACEAIAYLHRSGVLHRDLKPSNILVGRGGAVKVVDFGLARILFGLPSLAASSPKTLGIGGTPRYMAPEQIASGTFDTRTDVYSLGVVLTELMELPKGCGRRVSRNERRRLRELRAITRKALHQDVATRYSNAGELAADVAAWVDGRPVLAADFAPIATWLRISRKKLRWWHVLLTLTIFAGVSLLEFRKVRQQAHAVEWEDFVRIAMSAGIAHDCGDDVKAAELASGIVSENAGWETSILEGMRPTWIQPLLELPEATSITFVSPNSAIAIGTRDGKVLTFETASGTSREVAKLRRPIRDLRWSESASALLATTEEGEYVLASLGGEKRSVSGFCDAISFLGDEPKILEVQDRMVIARPLWSREPEWTLELPSSISSRACRVDGAASHIAFIGNYDTTAVLDLDGKIFVSPLLGFGQVLAFEWIGNSGDAFFVSQHNGAMRLRGRNTSLFQTNLPLGVASCASATPHLIAIGTSRGELLLLDPEAPDAGTQIRLSQSPVVAIAIDHSAKRIAVCTADSRVVLIDALEALRGPREWSRVSENAIVSRCCGPRDVLVGITEHGFLSRYSIVTGQRDAPASLPCIWPRCLDVSTESSDCAVGFANGQVWIASHDPSIGPRLVARIDDEVSGLAWLSGDAIAVLSRSGWIQALSATSGDSLWRQSVGTLSPWIRRTHLRLALPESSTLSVTTGRATDPIYSIDVLRGQVVDRLTLPSEYAALRIVAVIMISPQNWIAADDFGSAYCIHRNADRVTVEELARVGNVSLILSTPDPRRVAFISQTGIVSVIDLEHRVVVSRFETIEEPIAAAGIASDGSLWVNGMSGTLANFRPVRNSHSNWPSRQDR